jgi:SAM-dependent methyltransferase
MVLLRSRLSAEQQAASRLAVLSGSALTSGVAAALVRGVLRRRRWSLHRHLHLVAAFEEARARAPIRSVLAVGCGAGLSELYLAATHPDVDFTLTDYDDGRVAAARRAASGSPLANVEFRTLDLLGESDGARFDLVTSIEVLEHIEDDARAARHMVASARQFVWILVPSCSEPDLGDARLARKVWDRHGHHRPGYTFATLPGVFEGVQPVWVRSCYHEPEATRLRQAMIEASDEELLADASRLFDEAALDVVDLHRAPTGFMGLEALIRVPDHQART